MPYLVAASDVATSSAYGNLAATMPEAAPAVQAMVYVDNATYIMSLAIEGLTFKVQYDTRQLAGRLA